MRLSVFCILCIWQISTADPVQLQFFPPLTITGIIDESTYFVHDAHNNRFILKYHPHGIERAIHDALGAYIGLLFNCNINAVEIFPPQNQLPFQQRGVATLHSHAPGIPVKKLKYMNRKIQIKRGLYRQENLDSVTEYEELCDVVAFDIFVDNPDRHNNNIFFDVETNQFFLIDMDHSFNSAYWLISTPHAYTFKTMATKACCFLETLSNTPLSRAEIKALNQIKKTLRLLAQQYPPDFLFNEWMQVAHKAGCSYNPRKQNKIKKYLEYHAHEVERLLVVLEEIIMKNLMELFPKK